MGSGLRRIALAAALALFGSGAAAEDYFRADAELTGKQMYAFTSEGENVTIVLGQFRLAIGDRTISGRDAVLWIHTHAREQADRHDITVYIEGDARVVEPAGATTTDHVMLVTVRSEGKLTAAGLLADRPLEDFPLYKRALEARRRPARRPPKPVAAQPVKREALPLTKRPALTPAPTARTRPERRARVPVPAGPRPKPRTAPAEAPERRTIQPVNFHADDFNVQTVDGRRVVIARGNIYLSQGDPDSDLFLELRSQSAVVFLEKDVPEKTDVYSPFGPKLTGIKRTGEVVTGVYLEGDVVIARGERYFRGPAAFYDFTTDRAIVVDPVFRTVQKH